MTGRLLASQRPVEDLGAELGDRQHVEDQHQGGEFLLFSALLAEQGLGLFRPVLG
jgi:hypothetical protein